MFLQSNKSVFLLKKTSNEKVLFRLVFDITAQFTCLYIVIVFPLHIEIISKMYLIENKEVTLLYKLNR